MDAVKINILTYIKLLTTKKDFFLFDLDNNNKVTEYKFTNDLTRYRKQYQKFRVVSTIEKKEYIKI